MIIKIIIVTNENKNKKRSHKMNILPLSRVSQTFIHPSLEPVAKIARNKKTIIF